MYLCARVGYVCYGDPVAFTCRDCNQEVTEVLRPDSPYRNWTTPDHQQSWNNAGGPRSPEIEARFAESRERLLSLRA